MYEKVQVEAFKCTCEICGRTWTTLATELPIWCGNHKCRSRQWNGAKLPSYVNQIKLPAPRPRGRPKYTAPLDEALEP